MTMFADDVAELLATLRIESAHVVGVSLGGGVAFQLAVSHPSLVRSLVIVNSSPDARVHDLKTRVAIAARMAMVRVLGLRRLGALLAKALFPEPNLAEVRAAFLARYVQNNTNPHIYIAALRAFIGWSVLDKIGGIAAPTLVIAAEHDYTPVASKEAYVEKIPGAKLVVIPDSRHAVPLERPEAFNAALRAFLPHVL